jgi:hypothetical protein
MSGTEEQARKQSEPTSGGEHPDRPAKPRARIRATDPEESEPDAPLNQNQVHRIKFGGREYNVPTLALLLLLAGTLVPTVKYSFDLKNPSPAELLVAICISLFSGVVFLWVLDATSVLRFRSEWVSRSVYGAAIASILGTSVGVYKDSFSARREPYEGHWELSIHKTDPSSPLSTHYSVLISYSNQANAYWGYSNYTPRANGSEPVALEISDFDPIHLKLRLTMHKTAGEDEIIESDLESSRGGKRFLSKGVGTWSIDLSRPW